MSLRGLCAGWGKDPGQPGKHLDAMGHLVPNPAGRVDTAKEEKEKKSWHRELAAGQQGDLQRTEKAS